MPITLGRLCKKGFGSSYAIKIRNWTVRWFSHCLLCWFCCHLEQYCKSSELQGDTIPTTLIPSPSRCWTVLGSYWKQLIASLPKPPESNGMHLPMFGQRVWKDEGKGCMNGEKVWFPMIFPAFSFRRNSVGGLLMFVWYLFGACLMIVFIFSLISINIH